MDDENSSLMSYEGCDEPSDDIAANEPQNNLPAPNGDDIQKSVPWHVLLEGTCAALIFWVLGSDIFDKHGWPKTGDLFELLTLVSFLATAARFVLNYWRCH